MQFLISKTATYWLDKWEELRSVCGQVAAKYTRFFSHFNVFVCNDFADRDSDVRVSTQPPHLPTLTCILSTVARISLKRRLSAAAEISLHHQSTQVYKVTLSRRTAAVPHKHSSAMQFLTIYQKKRSRRSTAIATSMCKLDHCLQWNTQA